MIYAVLKIIHLLSVIVWVGGMAFAHFFLRPALAELDPPQRLDVMQRVLGRFLRAMQWAVLAVVLSGSWMMGRVMRLSSQEGMRVSLPLEWLAMAALGVVMVLVFAQVRWRLFPVFQRQVQLLDWPTAGQTLQSLRQWVGVNLLLAVLIVALTTWGVLT